LNYKYPLLKAIIILPFGYLINNFFDLSSLQLAIATLTVVLILIFKLPKTIKYISIFLLAGVYISFQHNLYKIDEFEDKISISFDGNLRGKVIEIISDREKYVKVLASVTIMSYSLKKDYRTNVILTIFKNGNEIELKPGYELRANSSLRTPNVKTLPNDFDESSYLKANKAHFFAYCNHANFAFIERYNLNTYIYDFKTHIKELINRDLPNEAHKGLLIALATGDKTDIDYSTRELFSKTGTAHVLAISGLHVGLIAGFFYIITGFIRNRSFKILTFLCLVWLFILLTGASASGVRAGFMLSLFFVLKYFDRVPNIINIALATFVVSILINPMLLYSISFQLSYAAIFGIIFFYKPIYNNLKSLFGNTKNKIITFICSSVAISFAATIPTSLFTAYYFNVFSVLYPIANIFIIPLVSLATAFNFIFILLEFMYIPFAIQYLDASYYIVELSVKINQFLINFDLNLVERGVNLLFLSAITSIILIVIFIARNRSNFILKSIIGFTLISILLFSDIMVEEKRRVEIIPREQFSALILNEDAKKTVLIADRKDYDFIVYDHTLIDYLLKDSIRIHLLKTSDASILIHDNIKQYDFVTSEFVSKNFIDSLSKSLYISPLYKIIDNSHGYN